MTVWAMTGRAPNPLHRAADEALCVDAPVAATVQELHLVAVHMLCEAFDEAVGRGEADGRAEDGRTGTNGRVDGRGGVMGRLVGRGRNGRTSAGAPDTHGEGAA